MPSDTDKGPQARRSRRLARLNSFGDLKYFFNWELIGVGIGTALLAFLELNNLPDEWPLSAWIDRWILPLMLLAVVLMIVPPAIARGLQHLSAREALARRAGAESLALESIGSRAANLVSKVGQVKRRKRTNEYLDHTMSACHTYFRGREYRGDESVDGRIGHIDVAYYRRDDTPRTRIFRKTSTSDNAMSRFSGDVSTRGDRLAKEVVETLCGAVVLTIKDFELWSPAFAARGHSYRAGIGVPVRSSVKDSAEIIGAIVVLATEGDVLHMSDLEYLTAQSWLIAASTAMDDLALQGFAS